MYYALIMAGGSGTRLWPLSRKNRSKQSLKLVGDRTMFQQAVDRLVPLFHLDRIFVVTRDEQSSLLASQVPDLPVHNFILEPIGRGTAPAIGLAAIHLRQRDPGGIMAVLTADHFIAQPERFLQVLRDAALIAADGNLVTLGIKPSSASTGFGYIQQGKRLADLEGFHVFHVEKFIEKPDQETASRMVNSGDYSWNSGMFIWRVDRILNEIERQMPELFEQLSQVEASLGKPEYATVLSRVWPQVTQQTIDYGVMEHASDVLVIPTDIGWTDVGSWGSLFELLPADQDGNISIGPCLGIDTHNTLVFGEKRLVATLGVRDMVIVDTEDALLVCPKSRGQEVREIVEKLKENKQSQWL
jgi:mannose-1-phosphate guanylyltransferase